MKSAQHRPSAENCTGPHHLQTQVVAHAVTALHKRCTREVLPVEVTGQAGADILIGGAVRCFISK